MLNCKITILILLFIFQNNDLLCQDKETDTQYEFGNVAVFVEIPEEFQDEDAVIVFREETIECDFDADFFSRLQNLSFYLDNRDMADYNGLSGYSGLISYKIHERFRLLTKAGVDEMSFVTMKNHKNVDVEILDARTIKPDGTVHELESEDIKEVDISSTSQLDIKVGEKRFAIPGVEIGDEIEFVYKISGHQLITVRDFYFHSTLPILESKLTLRLRAGMYPQLYYYNDAVHGNTEVDGNYAVYTWYSEKIPGYKNTSRSNKSLELPFVRLVMREIKYKIGTIESTVEVVPDNWTEVFESIENSLQNDGIRNNKVLFVKSKIKELKEENPEASNFQLFYLLQKYIYDSVEVRDLEEWEINYKPGYYLYKKFIDHDKLYGLYIKALSLLGLDYNICLAVKKTEPQIDTSIVNPYYFDKYLFYIKDGENSYFLYPSNNKRRYMIDEIPVSIEGTKAVLIPKTKEDNISIVVLPQGNSTKNFVNRRCKLNFNKYSSNVQVMANLSLSGAPSTNYRGFIEANILDYKTDSIEILKNVFPDNSEEEYEFKIDTIHNSSFNSFYPFKYKFTVEGNYNQLLTALDDSTYTLPLSGIIDHNILRYSKTTRLLDFIPYYPFTDIFSYYIEFEKPVKVLNRDAVSFSAKNGIGSYELKVEQVKDNMLLVNSKYCINSRYIDKDDYQLLIDVSKAAQNAEDATLILNY
jgi:uncharacterized protein DUF3857